MSATNDWPHSLTPKQREALDVLSGSTTGLPLSELRERGISADVIGRLAARGLVSLRAEATIAIHSSGQRWRTCSRRPHGC